MNAMMGDISRASISIVLPELYLAVVAIFLLVYGVYRIKRANNFIVIAGIVGLAFTGFLVTCHSPVNATAMNHMFVSTYFTSIAKLLLLTASSLALLLATHWLKEEGGRPFEYVILILFSTLGMMLMLSSGDMLSFYMSLEMWSLGSYVLASFARDHAKSSEAGLKYFVLGALASGMMLFGMSLVYGFAGSTGFEPLAELFAGSGPLSKGVIVGMIMIMIGLSFKLSAVPFHMWAPDVYEGAPTPVTAFFAIAPKVAVLTLFARVMMGPFGHLVGQWQQIVILMSVASIVVGSLAAMMQTNIKRLLAYSSIGHAGFMLLGIAAANAAGLQAILIYLGVYIFMSAGAFGCVMLMKRNGEAVEDIYQLGGLAQNRPLLAGIFALFMFSMAGIPPMAGFFGKLYVILAAVQAGLIWVAVVAVAGSVIGCFYYLKIVKIIYFDAPSEPFDKETPFSLKLVIAIGVLATALFFLYPTPLIEQAAIAAHAMVR